MKNVKVLKKIVLAIVTVLAVFLVGWLCNDNYFLGSVTLCFGIIQVSLMLKGSWIAEVLALFECVISCSIYWINGFFGTIIFSVLVYIPIGIYNIFSWKKNEVDGIVKINKFSPKTSFFVVAGIAVSTIVLTFLLSLIPNQNYSFLDSLTNILNIAGVVLIGLRYKEGWYFWIICNFVEMITWVLMIIAGAPNSIMMLIICAVYIVLDIFGIKAFVKFRNNQEKKLQKQN